MKRQLLLLLPLAVIAIIFITSCEREYPSRACAENPTFVCHEDDTLTNIRLFNATNYPMCNVRVHYLADSIKKFIDYGTLEPGEYSCYITKENPKLYPIVYFSIGEIVYITADSLSDSDRPYLTMTIDEPGYFTCSLVVLGELSGGDVGAFVRKEF